MEMSAGILDHPDLAHLHVLMDEQERIVSVHATTGDGRCTAVGVPDGIGQVAKEALRVCPAPGSGRIAGSAGIGLWRVERYAATGGPALVLVRVHPVPDRLEDLGLNSATTRSLVELGAPGKRGLVLILGDMRAGKSTLSAALLKQWVHANGGMAFVWADPPEHELEGPLGSGCCVCVEIGQDGYTEAVVAARRSRARYFYFAEARSDAAAAAIVQAGMAGPVCLTTAHGYGLIPGLIAFAAAAARVDPKANEQLASALSAALHVRIEPSGSSGRRTTLVVTEQLILGQGHGDTARSHIRSGNVGQLGNLVRSAIPRVA